MRAAPAWFCLGFRSTSGESWKFAYCLRDSFACADEVGKKLNIDIEVTFVLRTISDPVSFQSLFCLGGAAAPVSVSSALAYRSPATGYRLPDTGLFGGSLLEPSAAALNCRFVAPNLVGTFRY